MCTHADSNLILQKQTPLVNQLCAHGTRKMQLPLGYFDLVYFNPHLNSLQAHIEPDEALNRDLFLSWVLQEPRCIVWFPTMHRIASAETGLKSHICMPATALNLGMNNLLL